MLFNFNRKTKPLSFSAAQKLKEIAFSWATSPDVDHKQMWLYRYTTLALANAATPDSLDGGTRIIQTIEDSAVDTANLIIGTDYFYRILSEDIYGNRSELSDVLTVKYTGVADVDTDQSPPSVPSVVLASYTGEIDNDDTIDTGLTITVTPGTVDSTHPKAVSFVCRLYRSATSGGTYVFHKRYPMPETILEVEVPQKWFYKAEVRAVSYNGILSALSAQPAGATGVQPAQYLGSIPTPAAPTVVPVANGFAISWPKATYAGHKETILFVDGVELRRTPANSYNDMVVRTSGNTYTYTLQNVDKQGRVGLVSGGSGGTYRVASSAEVGVLGSGNLAAGSVIGSKLVAQDTSNIADNGWSNGDISAWTTQNQIAFYSDNSQGDPSGWLLQSTGRDQAVTVQFAVNPGEVFYLDVWVVNTDTTRANLMLQLQNPAGTYTFSIAAFTDTKNAWVHLTGQVIVPAGYTKARMLLQTDRTAGVGTNTYWSRPIMRRVTDTKLIGAGAVVVTQTDQTVLAAPASVPVLTQANQDIDGDKSTDIAISAAYAAVTGAVSHELEISTCATVGGTYVVREITPATVSLTLPFGALTTLYYKVRSRGVSWNGIKGAWSGLSTALKPVKPANTVPTVGTPTVVAFAGFNRITAPAVSILNLQKYNLYRYIGASSTPGSSVLVGSFTSGNPYDDAATTLVAGDKCWYYLTAVDTWDNESLTKSTGASVTYKIVEPVDVAPDAIVPSKLFPRDFVNRIRDSEMLELGNYSFINGPSVARIANNLAVGSSRFSIVIHRTGSAADTYVYTTKDIPVEEDVTYLLSAIVSLPDNTTAYTVVNWYQVDSSGNPTVLISTTTTLITSWPGPGTADFPFDMAVKAPATAQVAQVGIKYVNASTSSLFAVSSLRFTRMIHQLDYMDNSIDNAKLRGLPFGYLSGFTLSNNVTDPTNDINIAQGDCAATQGDYRMSRVTSITKRLDAIWTSGSGGGGLDVGSIANTTYHVFIIRNPTTQAVDALFSASPTSPTLPTGYTQSRRIGSIIRVAGVILPFSQEGDEFLLTTPVLDIDVTNQGTTAVSRALTVPTGVKVQAITRINCSCANSWAVLVSSLDTADMAPSYPSALLTLGAAAGTGDWKPVTTRTNTSGQIRTRSTQATTTVKISTIGWIDSRGKN